jgi:hypothetical protein
MTCSVVRATKVTGSISDDWIYWHFGYKFYHISPIYTHFITDNHTHTHTHWSSPGNAIKTQELALQITPSITHD